MSTTRVARWRERAARRSPAAKRRGPWLGLLLLLGLGAGAWYSLLLHERHHVTLTFVCEGGPVPALELTFFPDRLAFAAPSPPAPLGSVELPGGEGSAASVTVGSELVPQTAVVRYRGPGIGAGFVYVELGKRRAAIPLRRAHRLEGRVGEPIPFWSHGWRCAGYQPVRDAEVIVMGGGEHGIDLVRTRSDEQGRFAVDGFDGGLDGLGLRVRARGYGMHHQSLHDLRATASAYPVIALSPCDRIVGRLHAPADVDVKALRVLARGLPGVEAVPEADGQFVVDGVPSGVAPRFLVFGLADTWGQAELPPAADGTRRIEVRAAACARGRVVDAVTGAALPEALVYCGEQDAVRADASGHYELPGVLPGEVELQAQWKAPKSRRRSDQFFGRRQVTLVAGQTLEVDIPVVTR
ncbi:MAG: carboxypeptidase regulatory-like domain-containing protein [Planctomycetes bacterium]|nr:carboxypeptidase regulatory-like domain-containing protein [Planctomycetota bacterium]